VAKLHFSSSDVCPEKPHFF